MSNTIALDSSVLDSYDWIFLSPHLDDVALSCGGQIVQTTETGQTVLIVTVMAGDPWGAVVSDYVDSLHERWALATDATAARRQEDVEACRILGADALHLAWPDCIYRIDADSGLPYYTSDDDIFGEVAAAEESLIEQIALSLRALPDATFRVAPLGVGHHVDHQLTRAAAERCFGIGDLWYYEEYPYAAQPQTVTAVLAGEPGWNSRTVHLSQRALDIKCDAIAAFQSQLSTFFESRADLEQQVQTHAQQVGGERLWRRALQARTDRMVK